MSVAASRWAIDTLKVEPAPHDGGLSREARAVLLVLAADAGYKHGLAYTSADTIGKVIGKHERNVRRYAFPELAAWGRLPVTVRPGKSHVWHFRAVLTPGADARGTPGADARGATADVVHTPGADARGAVVHTPGADDTDPGRVRTQPRAHAPGEGIEGRVEGRAVGSDETTWPTCVHRGCSVLIDPWKHRARCDEHTTPRAVTG